MLVTPVSIVSLSLSCGLCFTFQVSNTNWPKILLFWTFPLCYTNHFVSINAAMDQMRWPSVLNSAFPYPLGWSAWSTLAVAVPRTAVAMREFFCGFRDPLHVTFIMDASICTTRCRDYTVMKKICSWCQWNQSWNQPIKPVMSVTLHAHGTRYGQWRLETLLVESLIENSCSSVFRYLHISHSRCRSARAHAGPSTPCISQRKHVPVQNKQKTNTIVFKTNTGNYCHPLVECPRILAKQTSPAIF